MKVIERPKVNVPATKEEYAHLCDVSELAHTSAEAKRELAELTGWEIKTSADVWRVMGAVEAAVPAHWPRYDEARTMQRMRGTIIAPPREGDVISSLARVRRCKGLTQAQLAEKAGMPQQTISRLERGGREIGNVRADTLMRLAEALGVKIEELLDDR